MLHIKWTLIILYCYFTNTLFNAFILLYEMASWLWPLYLKQLSYKYLHCKTILMQTQRADQHETEKPQRVDSFTRGIFNNKINSWGGTVDLECMREAVLSISRYFHWDAEISVDLFVLCPSHQSWSSLDLRYLHPGFLETFLSCWIRNITYESLTHI